MPRNFTPTLLLLIVFNLLIGSPSHAQSLLPGTTHRTDSGECIEEPPAQKVCCAPPGKDCSYCDDNPEACSNKRTVMLLVPGKGNSEKNKHGEFVIKKDSPEDKLMNRLKNNQCIEVVPLPFDENQSEYDVHRELLEKTGEAFDERGLSTDPENSGVNGVLVVGYSQGGIASLGMMEELETFQSETGMSMEFHTYGTPFNLNFGSTGPGIASGLGVISEFSSVVGSGQWYNPNLSGNIPHTAHIHLRESSGIGVEEQKTHRLRRSPAHENHRSANHQSILSFAELLAPRQCECKGKKCEEESNLNQLYMAIPSFE
ncbi:MAG: hypothetical protein KDD70_18985 [Bdellovibrionales bacterium]|nr:hypothetical protein [Bdellovibrionales bacterium]